MTTKTDHSAGDTISHTFSKEERLCSKKLINELFAKGSSFNLYPLRFVFLSDPDREPTEVPQVLVSVSKRYFKKAVHRNLLKRRMREAYRLHKHIFQGNPEQVPHYLGIIYVGKEEAPFKIIEKKLNYGLVRLMNR
ncbi:MAG: ribonuclease P protein component [Hymenobacteraceae bacterium]|nr:ribonuclease P protein component [Hymenobacteraceae bacterium]MDX5396204.1 ribonuclease P protein component [Hymenobacteraceae bacterium]MDX5512267.1 ribonuclease P protein component [Hymenobacteraceae bacterium]